MKSSATIRQLTEDDEINNLHTLNSNNMNTPIRLFTPEINQIDNKMNSSSAIHPFNVTTSTPVISHSGVRKTSRYKIRFIYDDVTGGTQPAAIFRLNPEQGTATQVTEDDSIQIKKLKPFFQTMVKDLVSDYKLKRFTNNEYQLTEPELYHHHEHLQHHPHHHHHQQQHQQQYINETDDSTTTLRVDLRPLQYANEEENIDWITNNEQPQLQPQTQQALEEEEEAIMNDDEEEEIEAGDETEVNNKEAAAEEIINDIPNDFNNKNDEMDNKNKNSELTSYNNNSECNSLKNTQWNLNNYQLINLRPILVTPSQSRKYFQFQKRLSLAICCQVCETIYLPPLNNILNYLDVENVTLVARMKIQPCDSELLNTFLQNELIMLECIHGLQFSRRQRRLVDIIKINNHHHHHHHHPHHQQSQSQQSMLSSPFHSTNSLTSTANTPTIQPRRRRMTTTTTTSSTTTTATAAARCLKPLAWNLCQNLDRNEHHQQHQNHQQQQQQEHCDEIEYYYNNLPMHMIDSGSEVGGEGGGGRESGGGGDGGGAGGSGGIEGVHYQSEDNTLITSQHGSQVFSSFHDPIVASIEPSLQFSENGFVSPDKIRVYMDIQVEMGSDPEEESLLNNEHINFVDYPTNIHWSDQHRLRNQKQITNTNTTTTTAAAAAATIATGGSINGGTCSRQSLINTYEQRRQHKDLELKIIQSSLDDVRGKMIETGLNQSIVPRARMRSRLRTASIVREPNNLHTNERHGEKSLSLHRNHLHPETGGCNGLGSGGGGVNSGIGGGSVGMSCLRSFSSQQMLKQLSNDQQHEIINTNCHVELLSPSKDSIRYHSTTTTTETPQPKVRISSMRRMWIQDHRKQDYYNSINKASSCTPDELTPTDHVSSIPLY